MHKLLVDTCLKAYRERAIHITDPSFFPLSPTFTSKKYAEDVLESPWTLDEKNSTPSDRGDTTYFAVGDSEGNCVSMIQSNYSGFGSGIVPNGTGVVLHNRGSYFTLNKEHHNSLAPGKRTFHTLCACFGEKDEESLFALGSMGGDIQPQVHVQLLTKMLDFGLDIQKVVSAPRWFIPATIYEPLKTIFYENNAPSSNLPKSLEERHLDGLSSHAGHAQIISFEPSALFGAADPRCSGFVDGF
jgi:gamma-glutamyltranspeptidase/glutathione hydrolase